jgi:hypothetical protein
VIAHLELEIARHLDRVDGFSGGVFFEHDGRDQRAGEIVGHQPAADAGLEDVLAHPLERLTRGHEFRIDHVAGFDAVLDHFHVAHVGREQRLHAAAVDAVHDQHFIGGLLQGIEEAGREHVAVARHQRHQHAIGAAEVRLVLDEGLHVLVFERQLLGERGVDAQPAHRHRGQHHREQCEHHDDQLAVAEDEFLERGRDRAVAGFA